MGLSEVASHEDRALCLVAIQCDVCNQGRFQVCNVQVLQTEPCSCFMCSMIVPVQWLMNVLVVQQVPVSQCLCVWQLHQHRFAFGLVQCKSQQQSKVHKT